VGDISIILSEGLSTALQGSVEGAISACNTLVVKRSNKRDDPGGTLKLTT
jgi:hypothetical protein